MPYLFIFLKDIFQKANILNFHKVQFIIKKMFMMIFSHFLKTFVVLVLYLDLLLF